jgi:hypothetical protein
LRRFGRGGPVFLSYRRADSGDATRRLHDVLCRRFGAENVFFDVCSIPPAANFRHVLHNALDQSAVLAAMIGEHWLTVSDAGGRRRLEDPGDFVRLEIGEALRAGKFVLPVLVGAARMPAAADLPPDLAALPEQQAVPLRTDAAFEADARAIGDELEELGVGWPGWLTALRWLLLPPSLRPGRRSTLLTLLLLLFVWALGAAVAGGLLWGVVANGLVPGLLVDEPVKEPHGWGALLWPAFTLCPLLLVLWTDVLRIPLLSRTRLGVRLLLFLAGTMLGSWAFYDLPWWGHTGVRQGVEAQSSSFLVREVQIAALWSLLLCVPAYLAVALADLADGERLPARLGGLLKQVGLGVGLTTVLVACFVLVFSQPGHASLRGGAAGVFLRVGLFFGLLQAGIAARESQPGAAA